MTVIRLLTAALCLAAGQQAQTLPREPASVGGVVLSDLTGQPLKRAQVVLKPAGAGTALSVTTGINGDFSFPTVPPGRYSILTQRDGFLPSSSGRQGRYHMPEVFKLVSGQHLRDFTIRLRSWGLIAGKVSFEDAEPAVGVEVQIYAERFWRGRHNYRLAGTVRTNDRGEYRVHDLTPGEYYVAALYDRPALVPGAETQPRLDPSGMRLPDLSYAVTFYPSVQKLMDAMPVRLTYGLEASGIDIFLMPLETYRIRGRVANGAYGGMIASPSITLARLNSDELGAVTAPADVTVDRAGNFEIRGVAPGPYELIVDATERGHHLSVRTPVSIGSANIDRMELMAMADQAWGGTLRVEAQTDTNLFGIRVRLEPRSDTAPASEAVVAKDGSFALTFLPGETYDLYVENAPETLYLKSVRVGNMDALRTGLEGPSGGGAPALDVLLSDRGGLVAGSVVTADRAVATGSNLALIPDPPLGRYQEYLETTADEHGEYAMFGVAPGKYVLLAWDGDPPCDIYDPDSLPECRAAGMALQIEEGGRSNADIPLSQ